MPHWPIYIELGENIELQSDVTVVAFGTYLSETRKSTGDNTSTQNAGDQVYNSTGVHSLLHSLVQTAGPFHL